MHLTSGYINRSIEHCRDEMWHINTSKMSTMKAIKNIDIIYNSRNSVRSQNIASLEVTQRTFDIISKTSTNKRNHFFFLVKKLQKTSVHPIRAIST